MSTKKSPDLSEIKAFALQLYLDQRGTDINKIPDAIWNRFKFKVRRNKVKQWRDEGGWKDILNESRERARTMGPDEKSFKRAMFEAFQDRKRAYENYFKTIQDGKMDNNAHWAYKDILTKLDSLQEELEREKEQEETVSEQQKIVNAMGVYGADY